MAAMSRTAPAASGAVREQQGSVLVAGGRGARLLQVTGLLMVAVLAGVFWWLIRHEGVRPTAHPVPEQERSEQSQGPLTDGEFEYTAVMEPARTSACVPHSYGEIHDWFDEHSCESLARGLYTTTSDTGDRALVSVSVVTMPTHDEATELYDMAYNDGTGNVSDLARERVDELPTNAPKVSQGQYKSKIVGSRVTIVEANFFGGVEDADLLTRIAGDARRLSEVLG